MKIFKRILLIYTVIFLFSGCDEIAVKNVQVPVSFKIIQKITIPEDLDSNAKNDFLAGGEYDILTIPNVAELVGTPENIKKIEITKIAYQFSGFSGNVDAVVSGDLLLPRVKNTSSDDIIARFAINPVNVANSILLNEQFTFVGDYAGVNEFLSQNSVLQFAIQGTSTHNPAIFNIEFIVSAQVTTDVNIGL